MSNSRPRQKKEVYKSVTPFVITDPIGVDSPIKDLQLHFDNQLPWLGRSFNRAEIMSRKQDDQDSVYPKGWVNENIDELEMIALDYWDAYSFFVANDTESVIDFNQFDDNIYQTDVSVYWWFNINDIKNNNAEFTNESSSNILNILKSQILNSISSVVWSGNNDLEITNIENNPLNVYERFTFDVTGKQFHYPYRIMRIDLSLSYDYTNC